MPFVSRIVGISVAALVTLSAVSGQAGDSACQQDCGQVSKQASGIYTPFGFFPHPPYKVWGNASAEIIPSESRVGLVPDCAAYEEYYGKPRRMTRTAVRRLRNDTWALHTELRQARADIREAYGLNDSPVMAGRRTAPSDVTAPYAPSGPRAYANTPDYHGPLYTGSFQVDGPQSWPRESGRRITAPGSFTPRDVSHNRDAAVGPDASPDIN